MPGRATRTPVSYPLGPLTPHAQRTDPVEPVPHIMYVGRPPCQALGPNVTATRIAGWLPALLAVAGAGIVIGLWGPGGVERHPRHARPC